MGFYYSPKPDLHVSASFSILYMLFSVIYHVMRCMLGYTSGQQLGH